MAGATISLPDPTLTSALVMLWNSLLLAGGCILLYAGATWLVRGASEIAVALKIPKAIVGLSLVAVGTSAPELIVNLIAAYQGQTGCNNFWSGRSRSHCQTNIGQGCWHKVSRFLLRR